MDSSSPINAPEIRAVRKWFYLALIISLGLHWFLYECFLHKKLERFTIETPNERLVPPAFKLRKVEIPEALLKQTETPDLKKLPEPPKTIVQNDTPAVEAVPSDVRFTPNAPPQATADIAKAITAEKPRVEATNIARPDTSKQVEQELDSIRHQIGPTNAPKIVPGQGGALPDSKEDEPGYSNIDKLLAQTGPLTGPVNPIKMQDQAGGGDQQGGALFEFGSAKLTPGAIEMLQKIGTILERNPRAIFSIEGYTDTFGTPAYNQKLSQLRAEAVKSWLVKNKKVDPSKIKAKGFGSTRLVVPGDGSREEQVKNRRVEIVITIPKN